MSNLEEIKKAAAIIKAFNSLSIEEVDLLIPQEEKQYTPKDLADWEYIGLNNVSFLREYGLIK